MSLINEALKKAQRQHSGGEKGTLDELTDANGQYTRILRREKPVPFGSFVTRVVLAFALLGIIALAVVLFSDFFTNTPPEPAPAAPRATPAATPLPQAEALPSNHVEKTAPSPLPANVLPDAASASSNEGNSSAPSDGANADTPTARNEPTEALPVTPPRIDVKTIGVIESLRIAGIRAAGKDSRVLLNDRVYRIGDIVDHELGLKIVSIEPSALTFENANGARYTRNF